MTEVRDVASAARTMQRWDRQFGGWIPYQAAVGSVDSALRLVRGSYSEKLGGVLLPAVADLCAVTRWVAYDIGRTQNALEYFAMGVQIARQGNDASLAAKLLCDMARVNADLGNPMQSVELLGLASYLLTNAPSTVQAKIHSLEAKTYAILGNAEKCERALRSRSETGHWTTPTSRPRGYAETIWTACARKETRHSILQQPSSRTGSLTASGRWPSALQDSPSLTALLPTSTSGSETSLSFRKLAILKIDGRTTSEGVNSMPEP